MNVLRTIPSYFPVVTGPANQAREISLGIVDHGFISEIVTTDNLAKSSPRQEQLDGICIQRLAESFGFMAYRHLSGLSLLTQKTPDIIHAHNYRNRLTTEAAAIARRNEIPFIFQPHGSLAMFRHILHGINQFPYVIFDWFRSQREVFSADAVVVATDQECQEAVDFGLDREKIHVIPVGADVPKSAENSNVADSETLKLLFVGRICRDRNLEQILSALAICQSRSKVEMTLVGPASGRTGLTRPESYMDKLKSLVDDLNLANVRFVGPCYGEELKQRYRTADLFVYTSIYENFGQSILEAAAFGCPVIATPTGVARDIVFEDETGFLVNPGDSKSLAEKIDVLQNDRRRLQRFSENIRSLVAEKYSWQRIIRRYVDLYESLL